jgi:T6SS immunity protein Tdi1, C-terminal
VRKYTLLNEPESCEKLGCWEAVVGEFNAVFGFTLFGDFFLRNSETGKIAILYTIEPEVLPTNFNTIMSFARDLLTNKEVESQLLRTQEIEKLTLLLGDLEDDQVFIAEPYPFAGGDQSLESYAKGNAWVYADLVAQAQGVGS